MAETAMWEDLPVEDHQYVWDEAENNFWRRFDDEQENQHVRAEEDYRKAMTALRVELGTLDGKRNELNRSRERLAQELRNVEEELARVVLECDEKSDRMTELERIYRQEEQEKLEQREKITRTMVRWFRERRGEDVPSESEDGLYMTDSRRSVLKDDDTTPMEGVRYTREPTSERTAPRTALPKALPIASPIAPAASPDKNTSTPSASGALVNIIDADGQVIGPVEHIEPWNQWVKAIQEMPIKRPVKIRRGRKFNQDHLASIYERTEAKGVKWLSCMIQAIGDIQTQRCLSCDKNQGAFDDCIVVGGPLFQKCGNCEWNRQGCHGAVLKKPDVLDSEPELEPEINAEPSKPEPEAEPEAELEPERDSEREPDNVPVPVPEPEPASEPAPEPAEKEIKNDSPVQAEHVAHETAELKALRQRVAQEALAKAAGLAQEAIQPPPEPVRPVYPLQPPQPLQPLHPLQPIQPVQQIQSDQKVNGHFHVPNGGPLLPEISHFSMVKEPKVFTFTSSFTPANLLSQPPSRPTSRPPSRDLPTPRVHSHSVEPSPQPVESREQLEDLPEITRETLVLRHNGTEYIYPEIVEGVPLVKIDKNHPYWDARWPDIRALIEPPLRQWQEKYHIALQAKEKGEKGSQRFQLGRQVNRGHKILEFLEEGSINPYQLLSKKYTHSGKGSITSYDTLFRMCETLSELEKYGLDMAPVDWMRQRLHELWLEQGTSFNVSKIIHNFYNDPKLVALRTKAGFKNIGRPSGGKTVRQSLGATPNGTPQAQPKKRKSTYSLAGTPMEQDRSSLEQTPPEAYGGPLIHESPSTMHINKRPKQLSPALRPAHRDTEPADFTDTDSWSGAPTGENDFRVYQVKSRLYTSSIQVTQYLHWVKEERCFEHQVLKELDPVLWGVHREPIDFNVRLDDIVEVAWNAEVMRVHLIVNKHSGQISKKDGLPRGDIMAAFKRQRTIRRFVRFCRGLKLRVVEESPIEMGSRWAMMQSERLPDRDEEASEELKE